MFNNIDIVNMKFKIYYKDMVDENYPISPTYFIIIKVPSKTHAIEQFMREHYLCVVLEINETK